MSCWTSAPSCAHPAVASSIHLQLLLADAKIFRSREFNHRVKSISMATFKPEEVEKIKAGGNEAARKVWLASWSGAEYPLPDPQDPRRVRDFIQAKYIDRRFVARVCVSWHCQLGGFVMFFPQEGKPKAAAAPQGYDGPRPMSLYRDVCFQFELQVRKAYTLAG
jgi:hypothetical protein